MYLSDRQTREVLSEPKPINTINTYCILLYKMFSMKAFKNCYYCIHKPLFTYSRFSGLTPFSIECNHENSNNTYKVEEAWFYKFIALAFTFFMLVLCIPEIYKAIISTDTTYYHYSKMFFDNSMGYICFMNTLIFLNNIKYRKAHLIGINELLQNGKLYSIPTLISQKTASRLRKYALLHCSYTTATISIMFVYFTFTAKNYGITVILQRYISIVGVVCFLVLSQSFMLELQTYQEILRSCNEKIVMVLQNQNNYKAINDQIKTKAIAVKYVSLEEQLINARRLFVALFDNMQLYFKFYSPVMTHGVPCFIFGVIMTSYTTLYIILRENIWNLDKEYCMYLGVTTVSLISMSVNVRYAEKLKNPVSI